MTNDRHRLASNKLLARLAEQEPRFDFGDFEPVDCPLDMPLFEAGQAISHVYFLDEGIASIVARSPEGFHFETGFIGREGFVLPSVALGADTIPHFGQMQVGGHGRRVTVKNFRAMFEASRALRNLCLRYAQVIIVQVACTAVSNAIHQFDKRLARFLLMCHDRSPSDDLTLTHEFMSAMLAVRRPTVTIALHVLEGKRLIWNDRGYVQITDRSGLELFAGDSYGVPEGEYRKLIGPL